MKKAGLKRYGFTGGKPEDWRLRNQRTKWNRLATKNQRERDMTPRLVKKED